MTTNQNQQQDLYLLIHEVPQGTKSNMPDQQVVVIDPKTRKAVDPIWTKIVGRTLKYYLVSNIQNPLNKVRDSFVYTYQEDPPGSRSLNIDVAYAASCPRGNEKKLAECFSLVPNPAEKLKELIIKWIYEYIQPMNRSFIDSFQSIGSSLISSIKTKASNEAGLALEINLSLPLISSFSIENTFLIRFPDYDKQESLALCAEIEPDQASLSVAQTYSQAYVEQLVEKESQKYFAQRVSLHSFYFKLKSDGIKQDFEQRLNLYLRQIGYRLSLISMDRVNGLPLPLETFHTRISIPYVDYNDTSEISIRNTISLDLQDSARYRITGSQDLSEWAAKQLTSAVNAELFGASHLDLLVDFEPRAANIKARLSQEASKIGYTIKHIVTMPELEQYEWLKFFEIKTEQAEEEFETNTSKFPVSMSIVVITKIKDLKSVKKHLNSPLHISTEMKKEVLKVTAQFLRTIDPERFYVRFSHTQTPGEKPVEEELKIRIVDALARQFDADTDEIILRMEETGITKWLNDLKRHREEFRVTIKPLDFTQPHDITIFGHFRVMDIDYEGWENFKTAMPLIDDIKKRIEDALRTELSNGSKVKLVYQDSIELKELENLITASAQKTALDNFGLRVTLSDIGRERTGIEDGIIGYIINEQQAVIDGIARGRQLQIQKVTHQIGVLKGQLADIIIDQGSKEQMKEVSRQIAELELQLVEIRSSSHRSLPFQSETKQLPETTS
jgi:hypothetical protein